MDGGYYSMRLNDGVQLVMLNTNYWHTSNLETNDPEASKAQMDWFEDILPTVPAGRKIIIASHISPGLYFQDQQFWHEKYITRFRNAVFKHQD